MFSSPPINILQVRYVELHSFWWTGSLTSYCEAGRSPPNIAAIIPNDANGRVYTVELLKLVN